MKLLNVLKFAVLGLVTTLFSTAQAAEADYTSLTSGISFANVITAILAVAALYAGVKVVMAGSRMILSFLRG